MVSRPAGCHRFDAFKPPLARIQCIDENINDPYRIGMSRGWKSTLLDAVKNRSKYY